MLTAESNSPSFSKGYCFRSAPRSSDAFLKKKAFLQDKVQCLPMVGVKRFLERTHAYDSINPFLEFPDPTPNRSQAEFYNTSMEETVVR